LAAFSSRSSFKLRFNSLIDRGTTRPFQIPGCSPLSNICSSSSADRLRHVEIAARIVDHRRGSFAPAKRADRLFFPPAGSRCAA